MFCEVASVLKSREHLGYSTLLSAQRLWVKGASGETFRRLKSELH